MHYPYILRANYGDDSIALIHWAYQQQLSDLIVVYVETQSAASCWQQRVTQGESFAKDCGFDTLRLKSKLSLADIIKDRSAFPTQKSQWCAAILKGIPFLDWLDEVDDGCESTILLAKRQAMLPSDADLIPTHIDACEFHGDRHVWHPIVKMSDETRDHRLKDAGFSILNHHSLECGPCINSDYQALNALSEEDIKMLSMLEQQFGVNMLQHLGAGNVNLPKLLENAKRFASLDAAQPEPLKYFFKGCGNHFGCGL